MVMLSAASALVAGSVAGDEDMANKTQFVKVVRPFWYGGRAYQAGSLVEVSAASAIELVAMGKATKAEPPLAKPLAKPEPAKESK